MRKITNKLLCTFSFYSFELKLKYHQLKYYDFAFQNLSLFCKKELKFVALFFKLSWSKGQLKHLWVVFVAVKAALLSSKTPSLVCRRSLLGVGLEAAYRFACLRLSIRQHLFFVIIC